MADTGFLRLFTLTVGLMLVTSGCGNTKHQSEQQTPNASNTPSDSSKNGTADDNANPNGSGQTGTTQAGSDQNTSGTPAGQQADSSPATPVFAFMGGYTSCGPQGDPAQMDMMVMFDKIKQAFAAKYHVSPVYLLSCYSVDYLSVRFTLSTVKDKIYNDTVDGMLNEWEGQLAQLTNPVVYIVGHSYGGWTAMDTALKLDSRFRLGGLATLDPISKVDCTPDKFLSGVFDFGGSEGCQRAPTDFGDAELATLAKRAGIWLNFYENQSDLLHSSAIAQAQNTQRQYAGAGLDPHMGFLSDVTVSDAITSMIVNSFAAQ